MAIYVVDLHLSHSQCLRYYRGDAQTVDCRARSGERLHFPARVLRGHMSPEGVHGTFRIVVDSASRLADFTRLPR